MIPTITETLRSVSTTVIDSAMGACVGISQKVRDIWNYGFDPLLFIPAASIWPQAILILIHTDQTRQIALAIASLAVSGALLWKNNTKRTTNARIREEIERLFLAGNLPAFLAAADIQGQMPLGDERDQVRREPPPLIRHHNNQMKRPTEPPPYRPPQINPGLQRKRRR